jgi:hypothetical protein
VKAIQFSSVDSSSMTKSAKLPVNGGKNFLGEAR